MPVLLTLQWRRIAPLLLFGAVATLSPFAGQEHGSEAAHQTPAVIATIPLAPGEYPVGIAADPTHGRVIVAKHRDPPPDARLSVIDTTTHVETSSIQINATSLYTIGVNPTTNRAYALDAFSNILFIVDLSSNSVVTSLSTHNVSPYGLAVDSARNLIYWLDASDEVAVVDGTTDAIIATIQVALTPPYFDEVRDVAVNSMTNRIYVTYSIGGSIGELVVIDGSSHDILERIAVGTVPEAVAVNELTNRIYVNHGSNFISVIDGASNQIIASITTDFQVGRLAVNQTTNHLYATKGGSILVIDGSTNLITNELTIGRSLGLAVDSSNDRVYAGSSVIGDGAIQPPSPSQTPPPAVVVGGAITLPDTGGPTRTLHPALPLAAGVAVLFALAVVVAVARSHRRRTSV